MGMTAVGSEQLQEGFHKAVDNAFDLISASANLIKTVPHVALGLAEIGQEELGKSLSCLAAIALPKDAEAFKWFWSGFTDHDLKAHRALLYELISPARIQVTGPEGEIDISKSDRRRISGEKEAAFYVDFVPATGRFVSPTEAVAGHEPFHRVFTLTYLSVTARFLAEALNEADAEFRHQVFSEIAFRICSEELYQQDMPAVFAEFAGRSPRHRDLMAAVEARLAEGKAFLESLFPPTKNWIVLGHGK